MRQPDALPASPVDSPTRSQLQQRAQLAAVQLGNAARAALKAINDERWLIAHDVVDRAGDTMVELVDVLDVLDGRAEAVSA